MTPKLRMALLLSALCGIHCAGTIMFAVQRSADQALQCDCEAKEKHEEISAKVKDLPADQRQYHKYYRTWCCGREAFLECQANVSSSDSEDGPPSRQQGPAGTVAWNCWQVADPTKERGEEEARNLVIPISPLDILCTAHCAQDERCQTSRYGEQDCLCACRHRFQAVFSRRTAEYARAAAACLETLECKRSDDVCMARGAQAALEKEPGQMLLEKRCMEVRRTCRFMDDFCRALPGLQEQYATQAGACLAGECAVMSDCLHDAIGRKDRSQNPECRP